MNERATQPKFLAHAAGQLFRRTGSEGRKAGAVQKLGNPPRSLGARLSEQTAEELDVLADAEIGIKVSSQALRHVGDAGANRCAVRFAAHVAAKDDDAA